MSPGVPPPRVVIPGFPRVSGDEPLLAALGPADFGFSPRERG